MDLKIFLILSMGKSEFRRCKLQFFEELIFGKIPPRFLFFYTNDKPDEQNH